MRQSSTRCDSETVIILEEGQLKRIGEDTIGNYQKSLISATFASSSTRYDSETVITLGLGGPSEA